MNGMQGGPGRRPEKTGKRYSLRDGLALARWILAHAPRAGRRLGLILLLCLLVSACNMAAPLLLGRAIDTLGQAELLLRALTLLGLIYALSAAFSHAQGVLVSRLAQEMGAALRERLYRQTLRLPLPYTDAHPQGDLLSRMTNDIDALTQTVSTVIPGVLSSAVTLVGCALLMLRLSPELTGMNLGIGLVMMLCGGAYSRVMFGAVQRQQKTLGELNAMVAEAMNQRHSIAAYRNQEAAKAALFGKSDEMTRVGIRTQALGAVMEPMMNVLGNASFIVTAVFGGIQVMGGAMTIGAVQACLLYARQLLRPLTEMGMLLSQAQGGLACAERVRELADTPAEADAGQAALTGPQVRGEIRFDHVTFSYIRGKPVLRDFTLHIRPRETVAIVGATGVGKTTLINLLLRFYEPDAGRVTLDGIDLADLPRRRLYRSIGVLLQEGSILSGTVRHNIAYGHEEATEEEIEAAAALVRADSFIRQTPEGYDTRLSAGSSGLSAGQRQLICLARVPLMNPRVLVLDEATSSVDAHTEEAVQHALRQVRADRTCILIAHRLNTVRDADRIIVLSDGGIAEEGTHEELLRRGGLYARMWRHEPDREETP